MDSIKGFFDWRSPTEALPYGLFYVTLIPFAAAVGFVAWLGWDWLALVLTIVVAALVVGVMAYRRSPEKGGRGDGDSSSSHHRDARTSTLDSQKRLNLDSKGPFL